jgi:Ca2+-transporting ATPase
MLVYVPHPRNFFGIKALTIEELGICSGFSTLLFVWVEWEKLFIRWIRGRRSGV